MERVFQIQRVGLPLNLLSLHCCRYATASTPLTGKGKKPWDKRFPVHPRDISERKRGGNRRIQKLLTEEIVHPTGIVDRRTKQFHPIKEMIPEFVVPDLEDFELKPYVSYLAKEITQNKLTPKQIFNSVYAKNIEEQYNAGKIKIEDGKVQLEDGTILNLDTGRQEPCS